MSRTLHLLQCFAEMEEWTLSALSQRLGLPLSTTHRLLNLCRAEGFVVPAGRSAYRPGLALYWLSSTLAQRFPLRRFTRPFLDRLAAEFDETGLLTLLDRPALKMFFAAKAEPSSPMRYASQIDQLGSLCRGATAVSLLAFLTPAEIATGDCARGAVARPRQPGGPCVGDLGVTSPAYRYTEAKGRCMLLVLREMAAELCNSLGGMPRWGTTDTVEDMDDAG